MIVKEKIKNKIKRKENVKYHCDDDIKETSCCCSFFLFTLGDVVKTRCSCTAYNAPTIAPLHQRMKFHT